MPQPLRSMVRVRRLVSFWSRQRTRKRASHRWFIHPATTSSLRRMCLTWFPTVMYGHSTSTMLIMALISQIPLVLIRRSSSLSHGWRSTSVVTRRVTLARWFPTVPLVRRDATSIIPKVPTGMTCCIRIIPSATTRISPSPVLMVSSTITSLVVSTNTMVSLITIRRPISIRPTTCVSRVVIKLRLGWRSATTLSSRRTNTITRSPIQRVLVWSGVTSPMRDTPLHRCLTPMVRWPIAPFIQWVTSFTVRAVWRPRMRYSRIRPLSMRSSWTTACVWMVTSPTRRPPTTARRNRCVHRTRVR